MSTRRRWRVAGLAAAALLAAWPARAASSAEDQALATMLFREARSLAASGKTAEACLKFEESQRLDPSGGTILNLAHCHEVLGLLARSWSEFNEAAVAAGREGRRDRLEEANARLRALEPRLSRLTIVVPPHAEVAGLRVERDGHELGRGAWSTPMPVDGGEHQVQATAPGRKPFSVRIAMAREGDARTVTIPVLELAAAVVAPLTEMAPPPAAPAAVVTVTPSRRPDHLRTAGWIVGGAGVAQLVVAGVFGIQAFSLHADNDDVSAGRAADRSTVLSITGAVTTAVGIALLVMGRRS
jgi:hypothetical protein